MCCGEIITLTYWYVFWRAVDQNETQAAKKIIVSFGEYSQRNNPRKITDRERGYLYKDNCSHTIYIVEIWP